MKFEYRYYGHSRIENSASETQMSFVPDTLRKPTHFSAQLSQHLPFREAICALHDVVVSDLRSQPKDRTEYFSWLKDQESVMLADFMSQEKDLLERIGPLKKELGEIRAEKDRILSPFRKAQRAYFNYLYEENRDAWIVLDPVITVHPDRIFFECFSKDESSYASLSCSHNVFKRLGDFSCGTTNIDYSAGLYEEFQKIRDYKETRLNIEPGGFQVATADDPAFVEEKIDLPDSWVRGFLQVSSAMTLPAQTVSLHPMDIHNICLVLRRHKERTGPRSIRFVLAPNQPVKLVFEPWNYEVPCPRSVYEGTEKVDVRVWGRRRLLALERLIPVARCFRVYLLGNGLPSFWVAELPDMQYTLGLSGWTANDWSRAGQFDLLAPRHSVSEADATKVLNILEQRWFVGENYLARESGLSVDTTVAALTLLTQGGRLVYDIGNKLWRLRELSRIPLPLSQLRFANEREEAAVRLLVNGPISQIETVELENDRQQLRSTVSDGASKLSVTLVLDADQRLVDGHCQCRHFYQNRMRRGPCEHMLAVRLSQAANRAVA